uniref:Uncharacterized protein n=1 Tax=Oryza sativa subsp. japonica TaxID=39947 RepID=Q69SV8_ORYSJ|nr:hypothetical protein [Oryza sativa Japonica Group]
MVERPGKKSSGSYEVNVTGEIVGPEARPNVTWVIHGWWAGLRTITSGIRAEGFKIGSRRHVEEEIRDRQWRNVTGIRGRAWPKAIGEIGGVTPWTACPTHAAIVDPWRQEGQCRKGEVDEHGAARRTCRAEDDEIADGEHEGCDCGICERIQKKDKKD